jgi:hypothetical protein
MSAHLFDRLAPLRKPLPVPIDHHIPAGPKACARKSGRAEAWACEGLEDRRLFAAGGVKETADALTAPTPVVVFPLANDVSHAKGNGVAKAAAKTVTQILPLVITEVTVDGNQLLAHGRVGGQAFTTPITVSVPESSESAASDVSVQQADVPILNLELGPIHLDLLGLVVDTSPICLDVEADPNGGLLGSLLAGIAGLLDNGLTLGDILGNLGGQLDDLLDGIGGLLNGVFDRVTASTAVADASCDILNLALGPIDLNLLGLEVHLDDCDNGPVTVDITAEPGPGNLLGNLLCGVAGLLDNPSSPVALSRALARVADRIDELV